MSADVAAPAPMSLGRRLRPIALTTFVLVFGAGGVLAFWAATAPLASAAMASGTVNAAGRRMTVQHYEGGIVRSILVREGDHVEAGAPLLELDDTQARSRLQSAQTQLMRLYATRARLDAQIAAAERPSFAQSLRAVADEDGELAAFLSNEAILFTSERAEMQGKLDIFAAQIRQLEAEIEGRGGEIAGAEVQLELLAGELKDLKPLLEKGLVQRSRVTELQRLEAESTTLKSNAQSMIAQARQKIAQLRLNIVNTPVEFTRSIAGQLADTNLKIADMTERVSAAQDVLTRTSVLAPVSGTVVDLKVNTPNEVVGAGSDLLDILPTDASLVVDARLNPIDIDVVREGLTVEVRILPFSARNTLPLNGTVTRVSADSLVDARSGAPYYAVEIAIDRSDARRVNDELLVPGMPAEVYIVLGERTFLQYLFEPILGSFRRSFREN